MNSTPLVTLVFNRRHTATTTKEAAVELRVSYQKEQKYMSTGVRLLPKHWRRGTVVNRIDAIQLNQTLEKLVVDERKVILQMMDDGNIDIFSIPDKLKRLRSGNLTFLDFCDKRMKIRQYGKAVDSQERYTRFMKFFRSLGKIVEFEGITDLNIIKFVQSDTTLNLLSDEFYEQSVWNAIYESMGTDMSNYRFKKLILKSSNGRILKQYSFSSKNDDDL